MLTDDQIQKQIQDFITDKSLSDNERIAFMMATVDVVRKKMAMEMEEAMDDNDVAEIEKIESDEEASREMVSRWEKKTGKSSEERAKEIIKDFFDKFLQLKDNPPSQPQAAPPTPSAVS